MGWYQYYKLLEKYKGDLEKASDEEMEDAFLGNPNDPVTARHIAEGKYRNEHRGHDEVGAPFCKCQPMVLQVNKRKEG